MGVIEIGTTPPKTCSKCGESKPRSEFYKNSNTRDRLRPECKVCLRAYMANWYDAKPPRMRYAPRSGKELEPISYVYLICRPDGTPLYVGKGRGIRWKTHARKTHNAKLKAVFAENGGVLPIEIVKSGLTDAEACQFERELIASIGREARGGLLVNVTDGGQGLAGMIVSEETRRKHSRDRRGRKMSAEYRAAMRAHAGSLEGRERRRQSALAWHASMTPEQKQERSKLIRTSMGFV